MALKNIHEFKDNFIFKYEYTNKNLLVYCDEQLPFELVDYENNKFEVTDISGCCLLPTTYELGKAVEYANLISDNSSERAIFQE